MRILFLSRWFPNPPDNGSKLRIFNLLRELSVEHVVSLVALADPDARNDADGHHLPAAVASSVRILPYRAFESRGAKALAGYFSSQPRFLAATHRPDVQAAIREDVRRAQPDLVIASQLDMLPYALEVDAPRLLEELELARYLEDCMPPRPWRRRLRARLTWLKLSSYLRRVLPRFAACTVVSPQEQAHFRRVAPTYGAVHVLPNAINLPDYGASYATLEPHSLIFSGALTYEPNLDAARYFVDEIFPSIRARVPDCRLRITGRVSVGGESLARQPGVQLTGYIPDVRPTVWGSAVAVVPLRAGGGTRLKILEAMALGTPVVSTSKGAEGLDASDGENILLADTAADFADAVVRLFHSPDLRQRISANGRALVASRYDWTTVGRQLRDIVDTVADHRVEPFSTAAMVPT